MQLTDAQLLTIRADITNSTDPAVIAARGNGAEIGRDDTTLAVIYSAPSSPAFTVWRTKITREEIQSDPGFNFTVVDNLSTGSKYRIWDWMFDNADKTIDSSKQNIRDGIAATWVGNAALLAVQAVVLAVCKRNVNRVERLFATGIGTTQAPGFLVYEGDITINDLGRAFAL